MAFLNRSSYYDEDYGDYGLLGGYTAPAPVVAPTSGLLNAAPAPTGQYGDWSTLGVQSIIAPQDFEWGTAPGGITVTTPAGSFAGGEFGKYSGMTQNGFIWSGPESTITQSNGDSIDNPDFDRTAFDAAYQNYLTNPTYTAQRLREDKTDDNQYQTSQYGLETLPDGTQRLVQQGGWSDRHVDSGINRKLLSDLTPLIAAASFGILGPMAFGTEATAAGGASAGAGAMTGAEWGALADGAAGATSGVFGGAGGVASGLTGLAPFTAPTTLAGSAAPLALSGTVAPATIGSLSSMLPTMAGGGLLDTLKGVPQWIKDNPSLSKGLFSLGTGLLGAGGAGDQGGSGPLPAATQWSSKPIQPVAYKPPQQTGLGKELGFTGRW